MRQFINSFLSGGNEIVSDGEIVNVFILTGQSNATGVAQNTSATAPELAPQTNFKIWSKINSKFENLEIGVNNLGITQTQHSIELGLATNFNTYYPGETGYLIKWAVSSTYIVQHLKGGDVYEELFNYYVRPAINNLILENKQCKVHLIYSQGERDCNISAPPPAGEYLLYAGRFDTWIDLWRSNFGETLPIANYQLLDPLPAGYEQDVINDIFDAKSLLEENYNVMPTKNLSNVGDSLHYDYAAHKTASILALDYFAIHQGILKNTLLK